MNLNLREIRRSVGLTQQQLASAVGATKRQIGAWERGENDIPMDFAVAIADELNCSVDDIAGRSSTVPVLTLDWEERTLIRLYRNMDDSQKQILLATAKNFAVATEKDGEVNGRAVAAGTLDAVRS